MTVIFAVPAKNKKILLAADTRAQVKGDDGKLYPEDGHNKIFPINGHTALLLGGHFDESQVQQFMDNFIDDTKNMTEFNEVYGHLRDKMEHALDLRPEYDVVFIVAGYNGSEPRIECLAKVGANPKPLIAKVPTVLDKCRYAGYADETVATMLKNNNANSNLSVTRLKTLAQDILKQCATDDERINGVNIKVLRRV